MSPRPRKNSTDVAGLYEKFDRRTGRVYYQYKNPVTGKFHGLGTDKGKAENRFHSQSANSCSRS